MTGINMSIILPTPVTGYFAADRTHDEAITDYFTKDAIVIDNGQTHTGHHGIHQWKTATSKKYSYVAAPYKVTEEGARTIVIARLTGNFPGSPIDLRYAFTLQGDLIERLEITL